MLYLKKLTPALAFAFLCLVVPQYTTAQSTLEKRVEIETKQGFAGYTIQPFDEAGLVVHYADEDQVGGIWRRHFTNYDTDFNEGKSVNFKTSAKQTSVFSYADEFSRRWIQMYRSRKKGDFTIAILDADRMTVNTVTGVLPPKLSISSFNVLGDLAYVTGTIKKNQFLSIIDLQDGSSKPQVVPIDAKSRVGLSRVEVNEEGGEILFTYNSCIKKDCDLKIMRYNFKGEREAEMVNLSAGEENNLLTVSATKLKDESYLMAGTYSKDRSKTFSFMGGGSMRGATSEGMYIALMKDDERQWITYHKFADLENFTEYMSERSQAKLERKKDKAEARGKDFDLSSLLAIHPIVELEDEYVMIGEAYYPTYRTETYTTFVNGQSVMRTRTVFDGFQYTHAMIAGFDKDGNLKWDQCFEMTVWPKPYFPKRWIRTSVEGETINMLYASGTTINSLAVERGEITSERESEFIGTGDDDDDKIRTYSSNLKFWYDNNFVSYGFQKIKDKDAEDRRDRKRQVFYFNKISFQ